MAERSKVCISTDVTKRASFLGLSDSAKLHYYELVQASDWDGAIPSPRLTHVPTALHPERLDELVQAGLIYEQEGYALVADHWEHNKYDKINWPKYSHPFIEDIKLHFDWSLAGTDRSYHRKKECKSDVSLSSDSKGNETNGGGGVAPATAAAPPEKGRETERNGSKQGQQAACPVCGSLGDLIPSDSALYGYQVACPECHAYVDLRKNEIPSSTEKVTS